MKKVSLGTLTASFINDMGRRGKVPVKIIFNKEVVAELKFDSAGICMFSVILGHIKPTRTFLFLVGYQSALGLLLSMTRAAAARWV